MGREWEMLGDGGADPAAAWTQSGGIYRRKQQAGLYGLTGVFYLGILMLKCLFCKVKANYKQQKLGYILGSEKEKEDFGRRIKEGNRDAH